MSAFEEDNHPEHALALREDFVLELAVALHKAGTPAHRLEERMEGVVQQLGLRSTFFATPTALFVDLGSRTRLLRVSPGDAHLERLVEVDALAGRVAERRVSVAAGLAELREILQRPERYGPTLSALAMALAGGTAAVFFGGSLGDLLGAALVSMCMGLLFERLGSNPRLGNILPLLGSTLAALAASAMTRVLPATPELLVLGGLIVFVPGLSLTTALAELVTKNLSAGTSRLAAAMVFMLQLGLGVGLGLRLGEQLPGTSLALDLPPLPGWVELPAFLLAVLSFTILFRGRPRDLPVITGVCALAWWGTPLGAELLGPQLGPGLGALAVGLASNLQARLRDLPASVALLPGIILLVPGSLGFRSFQALANANTLDGVDIAFSMFLVAASLVAGLLAANAVLPARRAL